MSQALEHGEHIAHAGHDGHDAHGGHGSKLGTFIGITMAVLGVLLALCAGRVGAERTELVKTLVDQQNAHAKYQTQDNKHRTAVLTLDAMHAQIVAGVPLGKEDVLIVADTVDRYLEESKLAKEWDESYDPAIEAHADGAERFELAQLLAEIGIVICAVALLLKRRVPWILALVLGGGAVALTVATWLGTHHTIEAAEHKIEETGKAYRDKRNADKATSSEDKLTETVRAWAAGK